MKKILIIVWTLFLIVFFFFFLKLLVVGKDKSKTITESKKTISSNTGFFSIKTLDSLMTENDYVLLTIAFGDCNVCELFRSSTIPDNYPLSRYYIDATHHKNNRLIFQSLYFTGFPLSYIIDQNYNIMGCIRGLAHLNERLDSIVYGQYPLQPQIITGVPKNRTYFVLSNSFKSLLSYFRKNDEDMKKYAEASLSEGSFFFNNYLMYKYYEKTNLTDSLNYYKSRILNNITDRDAIIYEDLLTEIAPAHSILRPLHDHH